MRLVAAGNTDAQIAAIMTVAATTARFHVDSVKRKLRVRTRSEAIGILVRFNLL